MILISWVSTDDCLMPSHVMFPTIFSLNIYKNASDFLELNARNN